MKKFLVILMVTLFVLGMTGLALALDPTENTPFTFTESAGGEFGTMPSRSVGPMNNEPTVYGNSAWNYNDYYDNSAVFPYAGDTAKFEGSYKRFDVVTNDAAVNPGAATDYTGGTAGTQPNWTLNANVGLYLSAAGETTGPHGNYTTASNKCKVCHAVHRANGAFKLLRVDDPADACNYCHIGAHRHSLRAAYFNGDGSIHPVNGHTIGAKKTIPDSSVNQWLEEKTLQAGNHDLSEPDQVTIHVRRYDDKRNKIFKWMFKDTWMRVGPTYLYCMSCHQVHNADDLIWHPNGGTGAANGYKLLRNTPSGSTSSSVAMINYTAYASPEGVDERIKVVEQTLAASTTGAGKTIYTQWKAEDVTVTPAGAGISVWCADCHNLNIGAKEALPVNWSPSGEGAVTNAYSHSDRTHPVPMVAAMVPDGTEARTSGCQSCHPGDMTRGTLGGPVDAWRNASFGPGGYSRIFGDEDTPDARFECGGIGCHIGGNSYAQLAFFSDWPHSAATWSTKLLGDDYNASYEHIDMICLRCHNEEYAGIGAKM